MKTLFENKEFAKKVVPKMDPQGPNLYLSKIFGALSPGPSVVAPSGLGRSYFGNFLPTNSYCKTILF